MDVLSLAGIGLALLALIGGNFLEGGNILSLLNLPAALIVFGGTTAAILIQTPLETLRHAIFIMRWVIFTPYVDYETGVNKAINWSVVARKEGLLGLEQYVDTEKDNFAKRSLQLLVDGAEPEVIKEVMEIEIFSIENRNFDAANVFTSMGGYSPTVGILGAVMGLIHVMQNLADPSKLGSGIATAFVATIYGVALANLMLLPMAKKLKAVSKQTVLFHEMTLDAVVLIAEGENPKTIEMKLNAYLGK